jgi:serine/threonine protein kinase
MAGEEDKNYVVPGEEISSLDTTYRIEENIGQGSFGQVFSARDSENFHVAVKIISAKPHCAAQAEIEMAILQSLGAQNNKHIVQLRDTFMLRNHRVGFMFILFYHFSQKSS